MEKQNKETSQAVVFPVVYVCRHGDYAGNGTFYGNALDVSSDRIKADLLNQGVDSVLILHSPLERAAESARVISRNITPIKSKVEMREELDCDNCLIHNLVEEANQHTIMVSHQPDIEYFLESIGKRISVPKGGAYRVR